MKNTALITGSMGFVGPYLKRELEDYGYEVFGLGCEKSKEDNYYCTDINDKDLLRSTMDAIKPNFVFHLAGVSSAQLAKKDPEVAYELNIKETESLLDVLSFRKDVKVLIASSSHVYGRPEKLPVSENHPLNGTGPYAESRIKQEEVARKYMPNVPIVIARSFNHTGPYQYDVFVIPKIISQIVEIKKGKRKHLELGDTYVKRDILDVRDVVRAYVLLLEQSRFGITCNVCRGESISLNEVIEYGKQLAGLKEMELLVNPEFVNEDDVRDIHGDNTYLKSLIDWKPTITYKEMIRDIFNYWDKEIV